MRGMPQCEQETEPGILELGPNYMQEPRVWTRLITQRELVPWGFASRANPEIWSVIHDWMMPCSRNVLEEGNPREIDTFAKITLFYKPGADKFGWADCWRVLKFFCSFGFGFFCWGEGGDDLPSNKHGVPWPHYQYVFWATHYLAGQCSYWLRSIPVSSVNS